MTTQSKLKGKHILITGDDEFAIKQRVHLLIEELKPEDEMNFEVVDAEIDNVDGACRKLEQAIESLLTLPFLGGHKLVYLKHCNFLGDTVASRSEEVKKRLEKLLDVMEKTPAVDAQLLISALGIDKRKTFYKRVTKQAVVEMYERPDINNPRGESAWIEQVSLTVSNAGLKAEEGVVERLVELLGNDTRALHMEIEKLVLYAHPEGVIKEGDLRNIVSGNRELLIWDLCDAVTLGNSSEAIAILRQLLKQGESEVGILILLSRHIRLAALCIHLLESGKLRLERNGRYTNVVVTPQGEALLPTNKQGKKPAPFRLQRITQQAQHKKSTRWFHAVEVLYQTHLKLLSTGADKNELLESAIMNIGSR
ncbi:MAG: DNA polymerase III subunit delta [Verrucomicrobiota bacterium]